MIKYKANKSFADMENKYFQFGTVKTLLRGGCVEMSEDKFNNLPEDVKEKLEPLNKPKTKKVSNAGTKKKTEKENK